MSMRNASLGRLMRNEGRADAVMNLLIVSAAAVLSVFVAYLIVEGQVHVAVALILFLPGMILLHKYPFGAIIVWLFLMPFLLQTTTSAERQVYWMIHRALPPLTITLMLAASMAGIYHRRLPRLGVPELAMAAYAGLTLASIYLENADPLATTYLFYDRVFIPFCLYLIIRLSALGEREMRWLVIAALFISMSQFTIGILSWIAPQVLPSAWLDKQGIRTVGSLIHASVYTTTLTFSGLLILDAALRSRPGLISTVLKLAFLLCASGIFISFSRAGWLAGVLVILGLIYLYPRFIAWLVLVVGIPLVLFGTGLFADQLGRAGERLYSDEAEMSALSRLPVFYAAIRMFGEKPLFGWGYGNFELYDGQFYGQVLELRDDNKDHASHNLYLTIIAEQGIIGLLLFAVPMIGLLLRTLKKLPGMPTSGLWTRNLLMILWLVIFSHIIVNNFASIEIVFAPSMFWIALGLIAALVDARRHPDEVRRRRAKAPGPLGA